MKANGRKCNGTAGGARKQEGAYHYTNPALINRRTQNYPCSRRVTVHFFGGERCCTQRDPELGVNLGTLGILAEVDNSRLQWH